MWCQKCGPQILHQPPCLQYGLIVLYVESITAYETWPVFYNILNELHQEKDTLSSYLQYPFVYIVYAC